MGEKIDRSEFLKTAAVAAAAVGALSLGPLSASAQEEPQPSADKWEAVLGNIKDLNEKHPVLIKAQFKNADGQVMEEEKVYVRWDKINKNTGRWIVLSAYCTHLKCVVEYNESEDCFKCPCHGSQYDIEGTVEKRPAKYDLPNYSDMVEERDGELILKRAAD